MTFRSAADLARDPALLVPPAVLVEPCAVAGRVSMVTLAPKGGKSTTVAGMMAESSRRGVRSALITVDEAIADSLQRLVRFDASLDNVFLDDDWEPDTLGQQCVDLQIQVLVVDHLGKLAERNQDFGANSQGDAVLWGRLVSPFAKLARELGLAVLLLDQARRSDGHWTGSVGKGGTVDIICELIEKRGGLVCTPRGRTPLAPFRAELGGDGRPIFSLLHAGHAAPEGPTSRRQTERKAPRLAAEPRDNGAGSTPNDLGRVAPTLSTLDAVRAMIDRTPGRTTRQIRDDVPASPTAVQDALRQLEADGAIENRRHGNRNAWYAVERGRLGGAAK